MAGLRLLYPSTRALAWGRAKVLIGCFPLESHGSKKRISLIRKAQNSSLRPYEVLINFTKRIKPLPHSGLEPQSPIPQRVLLVTAPTRCARLTPSLTNQDWHLPERLSYWTVQTSNMHGRSDTTNIKTINYITFKVAQSSSVSLQILNIVLSCLQSRWPRKAHIFICGMFFVMSQSSGLLGLCPLACIYTSPAKLKSCGAKSAKW